MAGSIFLIAKYLIPAKHLHVTDAYYTTNNDIQWRVSNLSYEYAPKGVKTRLSSQKTTEIAINENDIPQKPYSILSKNVNVSILENKPQIKQFNVSSYGNGLLRINT